ncbi:sulfur carrier protein ThiS [Pseudoalteromonas sp. MMG010]|uniref:sulfur carrier protein ThiS n=1 Tax=Pseudoalteromonas sp. MMG010 TaxID=2822685 RepID=UPI001B39F107|nr:sulfur carrier protein ThiS [Pseudoalteromonas sp. MMG010]MBQ4834252.1 sulfur carrier protein ThiS [Pseudoalteromonas sp. MMG010]
MKITVNGHPLHIDDDSLMATLKQVGAQAPYALAINGEFVPQSMHDDYHLQAGDSLELLSPIQGG